MGFCEDTAVSKIASDRWETVIVPGWDIHGNANGGYLLCLVARAMVDATGRPDPISITAHYLRPGRPGAAEIEARVVRSGRRFTTATATLESGGRPILSVLGTFGDLGDPVAGPERIDSAPPELPAPERCAEREPNPANASGFHGHVDLRLHPDDVGFRTGAPSGEPRVRGWFRLSEGAPADTLALLLAVDAFPPTIFNAYTPIAWAPTLELTAHVRTRPKPGWLRCAFTTRFVSGGMLVEDGEVWDESGRLVAQSRQLALLPLS